MRRWCRHRGACAVVGEGRHERPQRELPSTNPLKPKPGQLDAKAKSVIFLFMEGGPSQIDLIRSKAGNAEVEWPVATGLDAEESSLRLHQTDGEGLGESAKVRPVWSVRNGFFGLAAASVKECRRTLHGPVAAERPVQSPPRPALIALRQPARWPSVDGRLEFIRPRKRIAESARIRRP